MKSKKNLIILVLLCVISIVFLIGLSYAFFSYVRTSDLNVVETGDIYFNSDYTSVSLTNVFPIAKESVTEDNPNVMTINIDIEGHTSYEQGVDYIIKATDVNLAVGDKSVPISAKVTATNIPNIETYSYEDKMAVVNNSVFAKGNISPEDGNVNGVLTITAYIDSANIVISDTYDGTESNDMGTTNEFVNGRDVFTTSEWNSLSSTDAISFNIRVTAWEHEETFYDMLQANAVMDNISSDFVTAETGIDFSKISSDENGKGLYKLSSTAKDTYPIVYYRGAVEDNYVLFGNYCWKILRTTNTGGVKLIYNGAQTLNSETGINTCANTGSATLLPTKSKFNGSDASLSDVGYMHNKRYIYTDKNASSSAYASASFTYENGVYSLVDPVIGVDATRHYTCNSQSATGTCETIRYYYHSSFYIQLTDGKGIEDVIDEMLYANDVNENNSVIKENLETWFSDNLTAFEGMLEDDSWCNDRSVPTEGTYSFSKSGWNPIDGGRSVNLYYNSYDRLYNTKVPSLTCNNSNDTFNRSNINAKLDYAVGLITSDEVMLAGGTTAANTTYFLRNGSGYWTMSPSHQSNMSAVTFYVSSTGNLSGYRTVNTLGIRPTISLGFGLLVNGGSGTAEDPYVINGYYN